jgi:tight adherence protein C
MWLYVTLGLIFGTISLIAFLVLQSFARRSDPIVKRLRDVESMARDRSVEDDNLDTVEAAKNKTNPFLEKISLTLGKFAPKDEAGNSKLRLALMQAGFYNENSVRILVSLKILSALTLFSTYILLTLIAKRSGPSIFLVGMLLVLMGYVLPGLVLQGKIRRRQDDIAVGLPDVLDFLVICVEAGLGLNAAMLRVGQELRLRCKALSEELLIVNQEMFTGISRERALRHLAQRNRVEDLKILVGSLVLADKLGTNIADTLRVQSDSLRTRVRQRAEEKAAKAGIKLLFPLVFLIMPALFIVILGPGIIMIIKTLAPILPQ